MKTRQSVIAPVIYFVSGKKDMQAVKRTFNAIIVLAIALLNFLSSGTVQAQVPRSISYQGFLIKNNQPVTGPVDLHLKIYNAGGEMLYEETDNQVEIKNGLFTVFLGGNAGRLPESLKFDEQYYLGMDVDNTGEATPRTPFVAAPYALNSQTVGGIGVSVTPQAGMLLPLDKNGKLPKDVMPTSGEYVSTINGITGDSSGGIRIVSSNPNTLRVVNDAANNQIVLTVLSPADSGYNGATYSCCVPIPQNALSLTIKYPGVKATSNILVSVMDPTGQVDHATVGVITPNVGFTVIFGGYYPTTSGKLNCIIVD